MNSWPSRSKKLNSKTLLFDGQLTSKRWNLAVLHQAGRPWKVKGQRCQSWVWEPLLFNICHICSLFVSFYTYTHTHTHSLLQFSHICVSLHLSLYIYILTHIICKTQMCYIICHVTLHKLYIWHFKLQI